MFCLGAGGGCSCPRGVLDLRMLGGFLGLVLQPPLVQVLTVLSLLLEQSQAAGVKAPTRLQVVASILLYASAKSVDHVSAFGGQKIPHATSRPTALGALPPPSGVAAFALRPSSPKSGIESDCLSDHLTVQLQLGETSVCTKHCKLSMAHPLTPRFAFSTKKQTKQKLSTKRELCPELLVVVVQVATGVDVERSQGRTPCTACPDDKSYPVAAAVVVQSSSSSGGLHVDDTGPAATAARHDNGMVVWLLSTLWPAPSSTHMFAVRRLVAGPPGGVQREATRVLLVPSIDTQHDRYPLGPTQGKLHTRGLAPSTKSAERKVLGALAKFLSAARHTPNTHPLHHHLAWRSTRPPPPCTGLHFAALASTAAPHSALGHPQIPQINRKIKHPSLSLVSRCLALILPEAPG